VNVYVLGPPPLTLIDAGPKDERSLEALERRLSDLGFGVSDIGTVVLTHQHFDHVGLAATVQARSGARVLAYEGLRTVLPQGSGWWEQDNDFAARIMLDFDAAPEKVRREVGRMAGPRGARRPVPLAPIFAERLRPEVADPEDASTLAGQFQLRCRELILETIEAGFTPGVWIGLINTMGAVDAAKDLLSRGQVLPVTPWLVEHGRTELTMEHELTQMRWAELFTDEDRAEATRRLASASAPDA